MLNDIILNSGEHYKHESTHNGGGVQHVIRAVHTVEVVGNAIDILADVSVIANGIRSIRGARVVDR